MHIEDALLPDETLICSTKGTLDEMLPVISGAVLQAGSFVATGVMKVGNESKPDQGLLSVVFCLTDQRLILFKTTWNSRPKEVWLSMDLEEVERVELNMVRMFFLLPSVQIYLNGGKTIGFASAKIHAKKTLAFVEHLQQRIAPASALRA